MLQRLDTFRSAKSPISSRSFSLHVIFFQIPLLNSAHSDVLHMTLRFSCLNFPSDPLAMMTVMRLRIISGAPNISVQNSHAHAT